MLIASTGEDLSFARDEVEMLDKLLGKRFASVETLAGQTIPRQKILDDFTRRRFDIIHYAGHVAFDPGNPKRCGLVLGKKKEGDKDGFEILTVDEIANALTMSKHPLVFLNGCCSARQSTPTYVDHETKAFRNKKLDSLAAACLGVKGEGARAFIGSLWPVHDKAAQEFAVAFYEQLIKKETTVGAALLAARTQAAKLDGAGHTWVSFVYYGDPELRIADSKSGSEDSEPWTGKPKKRPLRRLFDWFLEKRRWWLVPLVLILLAGLIAGTIALARLARAESAPLALGSFSPSVECAGSTLPITIYGSGFSRSCQVRLMNPEYNSIVASKIVVSAPDCLQAELDLREAPPGSWKVVISKGLGQVAESWPSAPFLIDRCKLEDVEWELADRQLSVIVPSARITSEASVKDVILSNGSIDIHATGIRYLAPRKVRAIFAQVMSGTWRLSVRWGDGKVVEAPSSYAITIPTPTSLSTPTPTKTPTLKPTSTPSPSVVKSETSTISPTPLPGPTSTPIPSPAPTFVPTQEPSPSLEKSESATSAFTPVPVPVLAGPGNGAVLSGWSVSLTWSGPKLKPNQYYNVLIDQWDEEKVVPIAWRKEEYHPISCSDLRPGRHTWRIEILEWAGDAAKQDVRVLSTSESWSFTFYSRCSPGAGGGPTPTSPAVIIVW